MFAQLENLKKLNTRVVSLLKRRITLLEQIEMAKEEDSAARAKLLDMSLPPEDFTKFSNEARSAQRRRANLEDKLIDLEESVKDVTTEMYSTTDDLFADTQENNFPNSLETTEVELTEADVPADAETTAELDEEEAEEAA